MQPVRCKHWYKRLTGWFTPPQFELSTDFEKVIHKRKRNSTHQFSDET